MKVELVKLEQFRNIETLSMEPCANVNIICGDNAQGKTNLVEALWLLTGAKSFRGARDAEFIRFGEAQARVEALFWKDGRTQSARITFGQRKLPELNDIPLSSVTGFAGVFCAVVFSPSHLGLIQGGPLERRRFVDTCICQLAPSYISLLSDYHRVMAQRGSLLKDISYSSYLLDTLDVWDEKLVSLAALIVQQRAAYTQRMARHATDIYSGISAEREALSMSYSVAGGWDGAEEYRGWFARTLRENRAEDIRLRATTAGPHRDDITMEIQGNNVRSFGSQGQQRSTVLALKLAEARLIREVLDDDPVILLDDVMSELDKKRQDYLLSHISENQVFITCCDTSGLGSLPEGRLFSMCGGALSPFG